MQKKIADFIVDRSILILIIVSLLTVIFYLPIKSIDFSASSETLIGANDPEKIYFETVKDIFGDDQISVICLVAEAGILNGRVLKKIETLTEKISAIEGVHEVISLTNIKDIRGKIETVDIDGQSISINNLDTGELIDEFPTSTSEWDSLKFRLADNPLYLKNIISADGKATGINVFIEQMTEEELYKKRIVERLNEIIESESEPGIDLSITGIAQTKVETSEYMRKDLETFIPYTLLAIAVVLYITFNRNWKIFPVAVLTVAMAAGLYAQLNSIIDPGFAIAMGAAAALVLLPAFFGGGVIILPLAAVLISVEWTVGLMGYLGMKFSLVTTVLPSLLISIGIAYVIHVVSAYYYEHPADSDRKEAIKSSLNNILLPVSVTAFTTVIGFASLLINPIPAIRDMGILAVFGVTAAFIISITFVPAIIVIAGLKPKGVPQSDNYADDPTDKFGAVLRNIGKWDLKHAKAILIACSLIVIATFPLIPRINVDTDFLNNFRADDPIIIAKNKLTKHLSGSAPYFIVIDGYDAGAFESPKLLNKILKLQEFLSTLDGVDSSISVADYVKLTNRATYGNDPEKFIIPNSSNETAQLLESLGGTPEILKPYLNEDRSQANVLVRTKIVGSKSTIVFAEKIMEWAAANMPETTVHVTGTLYLLNKSADNITKGQTQSILSAVFVIFLVMSGLFLSFKLGALSMIPNIIPIFILFGVLALTGISLDISTSIIASIVIGLAVDDTIHFLTQYNKKVKLLADERLAVLETMRTTGKPISSTSITLFAGFIILGFSRFNPIFNFGLLTAFILIVGVLTDLVSLPAILKYVKIITLWDLLNIKIGDNPKDKIRLFRGLTNRQARIAALLFHTKNYNKGDIIMRESEIATEMYIIIKGKVKIYHGDANENVVVAILNDGDHFGEIAMIKKDIISSSAVAMEDSEFIFVTEKSLERAQKRYPRIANVLLMNLSRSLMDKLQVAMITALYNK